MKKLVTGLHHITALASDAQKTCDFYAGVLGLRLIKKTVNFDAPEVYHLYFGNEQGTPGTILTFFPYPGIPKGKKGKGQMTVTSFSVPAGALDYWERRLAKVHVKHEAPEKRFEDELVIYFEDGDGLGLELVFNKRDDRPAFSYGHIPPECAIQGFYGMALCVDGYERTAGLLTAQMDHVLIAEKGNRFRYSASGRPGGFVDVLCCPEQVLGQGGAGTVHHVAFATESQASQLEAREKLLKMGLDVTPVIDRQYFHSIYFREPGGVLFEIATVKPGFTVDESLAHLGESLKLPPWEEKHRKTLEAQLPPVKVEVQRFAD
jgi:glyoxalase family protein